MKKERMIELLVAFVPDRKVSDLHLRMNGFKDEEILSAEKDELIKCIETKPWGDKVFIMSKQGLLFLEFNTK